jgi:uncharacterized membrane protein YcaP (DUF421 family)
MSEWLGMPEWEKVLVPDGSLVESFLRGALVYFGVLALFRLVLKRQVGSLGFGDVMLLVLVSECVSQALNDKKSSIPNGLAAVVALLACNFATDYASYKWEWVRRLLESEPVELIRDGRPNRRNMTNEHVTDEELLSQLRLQGVDDISRVRLAMIESEGAVSVIRCEDAGPRPDEQPTAGPADFESVLQQFLAAARRLHQAAAWHDQQAAEHRRMAAEARAVLSRHGVRPKALLEANSEQPQPAKETG